MAKKIAVSIDMLGNGVKNIASPVAASDAATKKYVDDLASSLSAKVEEIDSKTANYDKAISDLSARVEKVETDTASLSVNVSALATDVAEVKSELNSTKESLVADIQKLSVDLEHTDLKVDNAMQHADMCLDLLTWKEINK